MSTILEVEHLKKYFGGVKAVDDLSFEVEQGSMIGLIGPNGAGKTTTFNVITGNLRPTAGSVKFNGEEITGLRPHQICKKGTARTFQIVSVFGGLSVKEHVELGALAGQTGMLPRRSTSDQDIDALLEFTMLQDVKEELTKNLTTAMKKRVELATALATNPQLLLLDELMAGLNYREIDQMLDLLRKINEESNVTLVVVEHVMRAVMGLCEKIMVLQNGRKLAEGSPEEIAENPAVIEAYLGEE